jgi:hypothetical protein
MPLLLFVVAGVQLARGRERRVFESLIGPEVGGAAVTYEEAEALESVRSRRRAIRRARKAGGRRAGRRCRRLQREQFTLGLLRSKVDARAADGLARQRQRCVDARDALYDLTRGLHAEP